MVTNQLDSVSSVGLTASWGRTLLKRWNARGPEGLTDGRKDNGSEPLRTSAQQEHLYTALQADPPDGVCGPVPRWPVTCATGGAPRWLPGPVGDGSSGSGSRAGCRARVTPADIVGSPPRAAARSTAPDERDHILNVPSRSIEIRDRESTRKQSARTGFGWASQARTRSPVAVHTVTCPARVPVATARPSGANATPTTCSSTGTFRLPSTTSADGSKSLAPVGARNGPRLGGRQRSVPRRPEPRNRFA